MKRIDNFMTAWTDGPKVYIVEEGLSPISKIDPNFVGIKEKIVEFVQTIKTSEHTECNILLQTSEDTRLEVIAVAPKYTKIWIV